MEGGDRRGADPIEDIVRRERRQRRLEAKLDRLLGALERLDTALAALRSVQVGTGSLIESIVGTQGNMITVLRKLARDLYGPPTGPLVPAGEDRAGSD